MMAEIRASYNDQSLEYSRDFTFYNRKDILMRRIVSTFIIGIITGMLLGIWSMICEKLGFGQVCFALAGAVIPVVMTGGAYLEGFMKTADVLHVKAHMGKRENGQKNMAVQTSAFAVISVIGFFMLYAAGLVLIWKRHQVGLLLLSFFMSRILSGMCFAWFPAAKPEGDWKFLSPAEYKKTARVVLTTLLAFTFIAAVFVQPVIGSVMALAAMWVWTYFYYMSKKYFGCITEEMAGYFLCLCELSSILVIGMIGRVM